MVFQSTTRQYTPLGPLTPPGYVLVPGPGGRDDPLVLRVGLRDAAVGGLGDEGKGT